SRPIPVSVPPMRLPVCGYHWHAVQRYPLGASHVDAGYCPPLHRQERHFGKADGAHAGRFLQDRMVFVPSHPRSNGRSLDSLFTGTVEADETYVGGRYDKRRTRSKYDKEVVFGMVERETELVHAKHVPSATRGSVTREINAAVGHGVRVHDRRKRAVP